MSNVLRLETADTRLEIVPALGAGLARLDAITPAGPVPLLRPWDGTPEPFRLALNLLAPFSNRISGGAFPFAGTVHPVPPNLPGQPFPIHGDAFQRAWTVREASATVATLALDDGAIGPFRYRARFTAALDGRTATLALAITNTGAPLPFGGGFHPWLPRHRETRLAFAAEAVQLQDALYLPTGTVPLTDRPAWDFRTARPLPADWINNAFLGWDGRATVHQPGLTLSLRAEPPLATLVVYAPEAAAPFFCLEPVSHAVDAHNAPGQPGLALLQPGETFAFTMTLGWDPAPMAETANPDL